MIEINNATRTRVAEHLLKKIGRQVLAKEKKKGDISVAFVSPQRARQLNKTYRKKNYVPNILSFPYGPPPLGRRGSPLWGGEIILCPQKISQDAKKYGILFREELSQVFIHGILHLIGYDHIRQKDYQKMSRKEAMYLSLFS